MPCNELLECLCPSRFPHLHSHLQVAESSTAAHVAYGTLGHSKDRTGRRLGKVAGERSVQHTVVRAKPTALRWLNRHGQLSEWEHLMD